MRKSYSYLFIVLVITSFQSLWSVNTPSAIPKTSWKIKYVDSQELVCGYFPASSSIDTNASTRWQTTYCGYSAPLPHEIQIDLGASYSLAGFRYLPRQDFIAAGRVKDFEFYTSADGVNWGAAVTTGILITDPVDQNEKQIIFSSPVTGRYVRFRALSEVKGGPWTSMAELTVLAAPDDASSMPGSFSLLASPAAVSLLPGGSSISNINTTLSGSFSSPITFSATGQPPGVVVTLSSSTIAAPGQGMCTVNIATATNALPGQYSISVAAYGGGISQTVVLQLTISSPPINPSFHPMLVTSDDLASVSVDRIMPLIAVGTMLGLSQAPPDKIPDAVHTLVASLVDNRLIPAPDLTCSLGGTCYFQRDYESLASQIAKNQMTYGSMKFSSPIIVWVKTIVSSDTDGSGAVHWTDCTPSQKCVFGDLQDLVTLEVDELKDIQLGSGVSKSQLVQFLMDMAHVVTAISQS